MKTAKQYIFFIITLLLLNLNAYGASMSEISRKKFLDMNFIELEKMSFYANLLEDRKKAVEVLKKKYQDLYSETPSLKWSMNDIELWIQNSEKTQQEKKQAALILIKKYLNDDRLQEAIWTLRSFKMKKQADKIEKKLLKIMLSTKLKSKIEGSYSANNGYIYRLVLGEGELRGIFRFGDSYFKHEVLAYNLDKLLELNIVPMAVLKNIKAEKTTDGKNNFMGLKKETSGSLQYYIRDSCPSCLMYSSDGNFGKEGYPLKHKKMWLLDYLLGNRDRHSKNWEKRFGNIAFAFDHEQILGEGKGLGKANLQENLLPKGELLRQLVKLKLEDFLKLKIDVSYILQKKEEILQEITEKYGSSVVCRALF
ncbi:MAG: hypothetical protein HAW60_04090 [Bdellovibrionales bacterium]|nr:hypothetical protein [Bdellovibrionales bacterium]